MISRAVSPVAALVLTIALPAQIVVDPTGGGSYTELQDAIDAAPPGSVIRVIGGSYNSLTITKSLTIIGDPAPTISSPTSVYPVPSGGQSQPPAIGLAGSGTDTLTLSNISTTGQAHWVTWSRAGPGIGGVGFSELRVLHSTVRAHEWLSIDPRPGAPAIDVDVQQLVLVHSDVRGSSAYASQTSFMFPYPGTTGVIAPGATVVLIESTVVGGEGASPYFMSRPSTPPCPCPGMTGTGGAGIEAAVVHNTASWVLGGQGGIADHGSRYLWTPWGRQPSGPSYVGSPEVHYHTLGISSSGPPRVGQRWFLQLGLPGAIVFGSLSPLPVQLGTEWLFIDPANIYAVLPVSSIYAGFLTLAVPGVLALAGLEIAAQTASMGYPPGVVLSGPLVDVVGF